jgi:signal transduction histidine kinase
VEKMDSLIKGILNYSSVENIENEDRVIDLNNLIDEILTIIPIPEQVEITLKNPLPKVVGNNFRYKQLFQNLIQNAIKYNDKDKILVEIGNTENDTEFQFYIKDNGVGIPEKYYTKVFDIFSKLENNDSSSGIGLSIVKKIIEFYKGKIWLESQVEVGTTFYFTITKSNGTA